MKEIRLFCGGEVFKSHLNMNWLGMFSERLLVWIHYSLGANGNMGMFGERLLVVDLLFTRRSKWQFVFGLYGDLWNRPLYSYLKRPRSSRKYLDLLLSHLCVCTIMMDTVPVLESKVHDTTL